MVVRLRRRLIQTEGFHCKHVHIPTYLVCITLLLAVLTVILVFSTQDLWFNKLFKSLLLHTVNTYRHTHIQPALDI